MSEDGKCSGTPLTEPLLETIQGCRKFGVEKAGFENPEDGLWSFRAAEGGEQLQEIT